MKTKALSLIALLFICFACSKSSTDNGYNTGGGGGGGGGGGTTTNISITDNSFSPGSISVKQGTVIKWINNGAMPHTATSDNGSTFNSGSISPGGGTYLYTANVTGSFPYHCDFHTGMTATLTVTP